MAEVGTPQYYAEQAQARYTALQKKLADAEAATRAKKMAQPTPPGLDEAGKAAFIEGLVAKDPDLGKIRDDLHAADGEVRLWQAQVNGQNQNTAALAAQRAKNAAAGLGGLTDNELQQSMLGKQRLNLTRETAQLNDVRGWATIQVQKDRNQQSAMENLVRHHEFRVTQAMKEYELGLAAITKVNEMIKTRKEVEDAYYKSHAPKGTSEYFRQLALGNFNAPRPEGGIALARPKHDLSADYAALLSTVLGGATATARVAQTNKPAEPTGLLNAMAAMTNAGPAITPAVAPASGGDDVTAFDLDDED